MYVLNEIKRFITLRENQLRNPQTLSPLTEMLIRKELSALYPYFRKNKVCTNKQGCAIIININGGKNYEKM